MKILIFSHGTFWGGAEKALMDLVNHVSKEHQVAIIFPYDQGEFVDICRARGIEIGFMPLGLSLPCPANFLLDFYRLNIDAYVAEFKASKYDLVICNTLATLQGVVMAKLLNLPCLVYAHEYLLPKEGLSPHGCSARYYLDLYLSEANHILCASQYVLSSFGEPTSSKLSVLYPFEDYPEAIPYAASGDRISLLVIGGKLIRKNAHFALMVLKALRLRGVDADLYILGVDGDGTFKLNQQINLRQEKNAHILNHHPMPFTIGGSKKINLICASNEPFGLTMTEALSCGVPVVASKCGGPEEVLKEAFLYEIEDLEQCVRAIERIVKNYDEYALESKNIYRDFIEQNNTKALRQDTINHALQSCVEDFKSHPNASISFFEKFKKLLTLPIPIEAICSNIALVSQNSFTPLATNTVESMVSKELIDPGHVSRQDFQFFDAVPFSASETMEQLSQKGMGKTIELAAYANILERQKIIAYVLLALEEKQSICNKRIKILFVGDGLGIDSLKIAECGFDVDYLISSESLAGQCANLNFMIAREKNAELKINYIHSIAATTYDAIVCLEVLQRIKDPEAFIKDLSHHIDDDGILLVSESFDGAYDSWPMNLYENEKYAGQLLLLMAPLFELVDMNRDPFAKPYCFKRRLAPLNFSSLNAELSKGPILNAFIHLKHKIGY